MRLKTLNKAVALAFGAYGLLAGVSPAWAASLSGGYTVGFPGFSVYSTESSDGPAFNLAPSSNVPYIHVSSNNTPTGNLASTSDGYAYTSATGDLSQHIMGVKAVQSQGEVILRGKAYTTYTTTITNTSSALQNYNFDFHIDSAALQVNPWAAIGAVDTTARIAVHIDLADTTGNNSVNAHTIFSFDSVLTGTAFPLGTFGSDSYAGIGSDNNFDTTGATFVLQTSFNMPLTYTAYRYSTSNTDYHPDIAIDNTNYQSETVIFDPYDGVVSLGSFAPGQSKILSYTLEASSPTLFSSAGYQELAHDGGAIAQIGDPFSISGTGTRSTFQVVAVPEPETYALMMAGIALVGGIVRRRKQHKTA